MFSVVWLVNRDGRSRKVFLSRSASLQHARMKGYLAGLRGEFAEGHVLDEKLSKKMPDDMLGRVLTSKEAEGLLERLG